MMAQDMKITADALQSRVRQAWDSVFNAAALHWFQETPNQDPAEIRQRLWESIQTHMPNWIDRQARRLHRKYSNGRQNQNASYSADIQTAAERLLIAGRHLAIVRRLQEPGLSAELDAALRGALWRDLQPQIERAAAGFQRSAARRGLEAEDLVQEAGAHFQQVVTRFNPQDARQATFATWFDDVITNLFSAAVRTRKSDVFHRGQGGTDEESSVPETERDAQAQKHQARVSDAVRQVEDLCTGHVQQGEFRFEQVLAFRLYLFEGLTYQEVATALKNAGYDYGTTQIFNFVKDVREQIVKQFEGDPFV